MIELWDQIAVEATVSFDSDTAATKAKTLIESYIVVIASLPDIDLAPKVSIEQRGQALHVEAKMAIPAEVIQAQIQGRLRTEIDGSGVDLSVTAAPTE